MKSQSLCLIIGMCFSNSIMLHAEPAPKTVKIYGLSNPDQLANYITPEQIMRETDALRHKTVDFTTNMPTGSVIVRTKERKLYYILGENKAIMYPVGVGREGFAWSGRNIISRKSEWPDWRPPKDMIHREAKTGRIIPAFMAGGEDNPLGARALYIGETEYRIHGTNHPDSIGKAMSSGCIRMMNREVIDLYNRVQIGAEVVVE